MTTTTRKLSGERWKRDCVVCGKKRMCIISDGGFVCQEHEEGSTIHGPLNIRRRYPRVVDADGNIRCNRCFIFKLPAEMARSSRHNPDLPGTICSSCQGFAKAIHNRTGYQTLYQRANSRALTRLKNLHRGEFNDLLDEILEELRGAIPVAVSVVPEHVRVHYGEPNFETKEKEAS